LVADATTWQAALPYLIAALAFGYLLGSIPFGLLITRAAGLGDVRKIGSGNIGATNVLRTGSKGLAALTLLLDALKGTAAVLIAGRWGSDYAIVAGLGAFLGHLFPVWLGFKGGKGVATYLGVLIGLAWQGAVVFALVWLAIAFTTRYSSLAALVAAIVVPISLYLLGHGQAAGLFTLLSLIVVIKHRANITRLMAGTESKIGTKG
jgi:acyl phosphate:glycerol-3-phosphate acyltransferase